MQSHNQKCNAFQCIIGIFLHSCHTPERVVEALARLGISISQSTIHRAVTSLSLKSAQKLQEMGRQRLCAYAYDNFDIQLKSTTPTVERSNDSLKHLTSGVLLPLQHVKLSDLKFSEYLWQRSEFNPKRASTLPKYTWRDVLTINPKFRELDDNGLSSRDRFNSWKFLSDLVDYGPEYFRQFKSELGEPEDIDRIPLTPALQYAPAKAMDVDNSSVEGNIGALEDLFSQGGVFSDVRSSDDIIDLDDLVTLVHGDLGTGERIRTARLRRGTEAGKKNRFQSVFFVMGLFHLKMGCADAFHRVFIKPAAARRDDTSLMQHIVLLRPHDTGTIISSPKFRPIHDSILHDGVCRRIDCWRVEVQARNPAWSTLDKFAESKPTWPDLQRIATYLALNYTAIGKRLVNMREKSEGQRDKQLENVLLLNTYCLLYEELSYAMNAGDIGRVEACFAPWILIFKATGKHKYATHMIRLLELRRAIRYNMLINLSGLPGKFRAVDWLVELLNYYIKVINPLYLGTTETNLKIYR